MQGKIEGHAEARYTDDTLHVAYALRVHGGVRSPGNSGRQRKQAACGPAADGRAVTQRHHLPTSFSISASTRASLLVRGMDIGSSSSALVSRASRTCGHKEGGHSTQRRSVIAPLGQAVQRALPVL